MTNLTVHQRASTAIALPSPRESIVGGPITIRRASLPPHGGADVMFIDALQKKHNKMVGFMPMSQLRKRIEAGQVLVAQNPATTERIGYIIFADKYFRREDMGIVYQLNIAPHMQRGLVGAALVKAAFDACPWGVRLFCCWCAQDLEANYFWESIGFVPIAFRAGSRGKAQGGKRKEGRVQIMWQKRIREGDAETPYWYPTETSGGAMKENRIVLPIPVGKHWSDELPMVLPEELAREGNLALDDGGAKDKGRGGGKKKASERADSKGRGTKKDKTPGSESRGTKTKPRRGLWFASASNGPPISAAQASEAPTATPASAQASAQSALAVPAKPKRVRHRNDPAHIAFARELRDRYLDEVNSGRLLPGDDAAAKYQVSRQLPPTAPGPGLPTPSGLVLEQTPMTHLLEAA